MTTRSNFGDIKTINDIREYTLNATSYLEGIRNVTCFDASIPEEVYETYRSLWMGQSYWIEVLNGPERKWVNYILDETRNWLITEGNCTPEELYNMDILPLIVPEKIKIPVIGCPHCGTETTRDALWFGEPIPTKKACAQCGLLYQSPENEALDTDDGFPHFLPMKNVRDVLGNVGQHLYGYLPSASKPWDEQERLQAIDMGGWDILLSHLQSTGWTVWSEYETERYNELTKINPIATHSGKPLLRYDTPVDLLLGFDPFLSFPSAWNTYLSTALRPGGRAFFVLPNLLGWQALWAKARWRPLQNRKVWWTPSLVQAHLALTPDLQMVARLPIHSLDHLTWFPREKFSIASTFFAAAGKIGEYRSAWDIWILEKTGALAQSGSLHQ